MKTLLLLAFLQQSAFIVHWDTLTKSTGESIKLVYDDVIAQGEPMLFQLYMATSVSTKPVKLAEQTSSTFNITMPATTTREYRYFVVPVVLNSAGAVISSGPESNSVLVVRR